MYIQMNTYMYIYIFTYIYVYIYIYIFVYVHAHVYNTILTTHAHQPFKFLVLQTIVSILDKLQNLKTGGLFRWGRGLHRIKKFAYSTNFKWTLLLQHAWSCVFLLEHALFAEVAQEWDACQYICRVRVGNACLYICKSSCNFNVILECVSMHMVNPCSLQEWNACQYICRGCVKQCVSLSLTHTHTNTHTHTHKYTLMFRIPAVHMWTYVPRNVAVPWWWLCACVHECVCVCRVV